MNRRTVLILAAAALAALVILGHAGTASATASQIRIMAAGDSITLGADGSSGATPLPYGGYRGHLWMLLWRDFNVLPVGSQTAPTFPPEWHLDWGGHEGYSGGRLYTLINTVPASVTTYQPDIVLLMAGTNDIGESGYAIDGGILRTRMAALIEAIDAAKPGVAIIVGTIPPVRASVNPSGPAAIGSYNVNQLPFAVQDARLAGVANVRLAGISDALLDSDLAADGGHPNDSGYVKMAAAWYAALTHVSSLTWAA